MMLESELTGSKHHIMTLQANATDKVAHMKKVIKIDTESAVKGLIFLNLIYLHIKTLQLDKKLLFQKAVVRQLTNKIFNFQFDTYIKSLLIFVWVGAHLSSCHNYST